MAHRVLSRRQFLKSAAGVGLALTAATALPPRTAKADEEPPTSAAQASDALNDPEVQTWLAMTFGPLFVAGQYLNAFKHNLDSENLPADLKRKYRLAGNEWKSWPAAKAIGETVPAQVRARGPDALWEFHKGKDWSHILPRAIGGPATAGNGIWWTAEQNRSLGPGRMSAADLADARSILNHAATKAAIVQTVQASVKGGMAGIIIGATLGCLELGLECAEGEISVEEFAWRVVERTVIAGAAVAAITGLLVGISLFFPVIIPIILPVVFILQIVGLAFLAVHAHSLLGRWWKLLNDQGLLDWFNDVAETTENVLSETYDEVQGSVLGTIRGWVDEVARVVGVEKAWQLLTDLLRQMGAEQALVWVTSRTSSVASKASGVVSAINRWNFEGPELSVNPDEISQLVARVVTSEFETASASVAMMRQSISEYRESASLQGASRPAAG